MSSCTAACWLVVAPARTCDQWHDTAPLSECRLRAARDTASVRPLAPTDAPARPAGRCDRRSETRARIDSSPHLTAWACGRLPVGRRPLAFPRAPESEISTC